MVNANKSKPQKKRNLDISQRTPSTQLRLPSKSDGRPTDVDLVLLSDHLANQERQIQEEIEQKISQHEQWNNGYLDMTRTPLTPPLETGVGSTFRTATTEYLPTPPASVSSEHSGDVVTDIGTSNLGKGDSVAVRYASPSYDGPCNTQPSFRRRYGRGGRLWIDRRGMRVPSKEGADALTLDRFKYDDDDDEEKPVYGIDPFDTESMRFRARMFGPTQAQLQASRRAQNEGHISGHNSTLSTWLR